MEKKFISIKEVSQLLSLSIPMIKKLLAEGKIPSYKVEGRRLFDRDELVEWVKSKKDTKYKETT